MKNIFCLQDYQYYITRQYEFENIVYSLEITYTNFPSFLYLFFSVFRGTSSCHTYQYSSFLEVVHFVNISTVCSSRTFAWPQGSSMLKRDKTKQEKSKDREIFQPMDWENLSLKHQAEIYGIYMQTIILIYDYYVLKEGISVGTFLEQVIEIDSYLLSYPITRFLYIFHQPKDGFPRGQRNYWCDEMRLLHHYYGVVLACTKMFWQK